MCEACNAAFGLDMETPCTAKRKSCVATLCADYMETLCTAKRKSCVATLCAENVNAVCMLRERSNVACETLYRLQTEL